jgi:hypothetical protein
MESMVSGVNIRELIGTELRQYSSSSSSSHERERRLEELKREQEEQTRIQAEQLANHRREMQSMSMALMTSIGKFDKELISVRKQFADFDTKISPLYGLTKLAPAHQTGDS